MSIDKWLKQDKERELDKKIQDQQLKELKNKKIQKLKSELKKKETIKSDSNNFLIYFTEFKDWLSKRTYLKGDMDEIATWINNLYNKLKLDVQQNDDEENDTERLDLKNQYKKIPLSFLDDKTRIALNKIVYGQNRTNSDNYYVKKLNIEIQDKLKEAEYYRILKKILELKN